MDLRLQGCFTHYIHTTFNVRKGRAIWNITSLAQSSEKILHRSIWDFSNRKASRRENLCSIALWHHYCVPSSNCDHRVFFPVKQWCFWMHMAAGKVADWHLGQSPEAWLCQSYISLPRKPWQQRPLSREQTLKHDLAEAECFADAIA